MIHSQVMSDLPEHRLATFEDLLALPGDARAEIINGVVVEKGATSWEHNNAQSSIDTQVSWRFKRGDGDDDRPGGWWILVEAEVEYETHEVYHHDLAGWRRARLTEIPKGRPTRIPPDWACEILSPSNWANDTVKKFRTLQKVGVPWYWIVDVDHGTITVHRWTESGYLIELVGQQGERLRLPPFDAVELEVGVLLGDDPTD